TLLALRLRARGVLVPILALPVLVPALLASTNGTAAALAGNETVWLGWTGLAVAFALVYAVLGLTIVPASTE
ncbi:MAG: transcriptional regulator, partial [Chloroflexi bacterium]|nr:transcriptional regulator [Chloroflexota bacterium]